MKNSTHILMSLAAAAFLSVGALAQTTTGSTTSGAGPGVNDPKHPRVNQINRREARQQQRIANGAKNGKLNSAQTARLEKGESRLQANEQKDMAAHNGHLTKKNQQQLNREANHMSGRIHKAKHPAATK